jgi:hypothetical protein
LVELADFSQLTRKQSMEVPLKSTLAYGLGLYLELPHQTEVFIINSPPKEYGAGRDRKRQEKINANSNSPDW